MPDRFSRRQLLAGASTLATAAIATPRAVDRLSDRPAVGVAGSHGTDGDDIDRGQRRSPVTLESAIDNRLESAIDKHDIVGAAVAVVHDNDVTFAKGYGDAVADERPVVADETLFRVASLSKPIVWTAVMQLIDAERIDPHEDVRSYLDSVSIPGDDPLTIAHLATHTAGFEDRFQGTYVDGDVRPLAEVLTAEQPDRVRPPGELVSYSNYGAALAAQAVADVTGLSFEAYADTHVFAPLGMDSATFGQPLSGSRAANAATGYHTRDDTPTEGPTYAFELEPAGSMAATVTDLARFVQAILGDGSVDGDRILSSSAVDRLTEQWFTHHDAVDGVAFGWFEDSWGNVRLLEHDGFLTGLFASRLVLVPEHDLGVVIATNTDTGREITGDIVGAVLSEYVSGNQTPTPAPESRPERATDLEGRYRSVRVVESTHSTFVSTQQARTIDVTIDDDDTLVTETDGETRRWAEREPLVFDELEGDGTLAFGERDGGVTYLFLGPHAFERVSWSNRLAVHTGLTGVTVLGMLSGAAGWPLGRGWRRLRVGNTASASASIETTDPGPEPEPTPAVDSAQPTVDRAQARWLAGLTIACLLAFPVGVSQLLLVSPYTLLSDPPLVFRLLSVLPIVGAVGTAVSAGVTIQAWRAGWWSRAARIHYTIVVSAAIGFCLLLGYWNALPLPV